MSHRANELLAHADGQAGPAPQDRGSHRASVHPLTPPFFSAAQATAANNEGPIAGIKYLMPAKHAETNLLRVSYPCIDDVAAAAAAAAAAPAARVVDHA